MKQFCSHCGTPLTLNNTQSIDVAAHLTIGEHHEDGNDFDWENGQEFRQCNQCGGVNLDCNYFPTKDELEACL